MLNKKLKGLFLSSIMAISLSTELSNATNLAMRSTNMTGNQAKYGIENQDPENNSKSRIDNDEKGKGCGTDLCCEYTAPNHSHGFHSFMTASALAIAIAGVVVASQANQFYRDHFEYSNGKLSFKNPINLGDVNAKTITADTMKVGDSIDFGNNATITKTDNGISISIIDGPFKSISYFELPKVVNGGIVGSERITSTEVTLPPLIGATTSAPVEVELSYVGTDGISFGINGATQAQYPITANGGDVYNKVIGANGMPTALSLESLNVGSIAFTGANPSLDMKTGKIQFRISPLGSTTHEISSAGVHATQSGGVINLSVNGTTVGSFSGTQFTSNFNSEVIGNSRVNGNSQVNGVLTASGPLSYTSLKITGNFEVGGDIFARGDINQSDDKKFSFVSFTNPISHASSTATTNTGGTEISNGVISRFGTNTLSFRINGNGNPQTQLTISETAVNFAGNNIENTGSATFGGAVVTPSVQTNALSTVTSGNTIAFNSLCQFNHHVRISDNKDLIVGDAATSTGKITVNSANNGIILNRASAGAMITFQVGGTNTGNPLSTLSPSISTT
jgi:hypothetical protein